METAVGLARDLIVAIIGLLILFDLASWTDEQVAGILLVFSTAAAFGTWAYKSWKASQGGV